jgi:hypothetical protein
MERSCGFKCRTDSGGDSGKDFDLVKKKKNLILAFHSQICLHSDLREPIPGYFLEGVTVLQEQRENMSLISKHIYLPTVPFIKNKPQVAR